MLDDLDRLLLFFLIEDRLAPTSGLILKTNGPLVFPVIKPDANCIAIDFIDVGDLVYAVAPRTEQDRVSAPVVS